VGHGRASVCICPCVPNAPPSGAVPVRHEREKKSDEGEPSAEGAVVCVRRRRRPPDLRLAKVSLSPPRLILDDATQADLAVRLFLCARWTGPRGLETMRVHKENPTDRRWP